MDGSEALGAAMTNESPRYNHRALQGLAVQLLTTAGMATAKAEAMAEGLVEADMLGHTTHGLALLPRYLDEIAKGDVTRDGEPEVISDRGACLCWNGKRLPGLWLVKEAIKLGLSRANSFGMAAIAIGNSHHIGCLAAYLLPVTQQGFAITIQNSSPAAAIVAPFGGLSGALSTAPIAIGYPTTGAPVLIDTSASITTNNAAQRQRQKGAVFDHEWLLDENGHPSADPQVLARGGSLLPAGGLDHGQKGYGWALYTEGFSQGFSGHGRADARAGQMNAVFLQIFNPQAFAGLAAFQQQTGAIVAACHNAASRDSERRVRVPGENALRIRAIALEQGVQLYPGVIDALRSSAKSLNVPIDRL